MVKGLFQSDSFAIIGASENKDKVGHVIFKNLITEGIKTYPINMKDEEILGKKCYKSVLEIKDKIDCAVIAVKAEIVPIVLEEVGEKGIKNVIVISSGFSECGCYSLSEKIKSIAEKYKINLLGPNTLGFINPYTRVNTTFFNGIPDKGKIAFLSQSGAIGVSILDKEIKLSGFVSLGNSLLTDFSELIDYFSIDKNTEIITLYIESLKKGEGRKFIEACKRCKKPIVALKAGKTNEGKKAASSHTAALASEEGIYEGVFKQCNIIEVDSINQLFQVADTYVKLGKIGKRACVVTNAGGPAVLISYYLIKNKIELSTLPDKIKNELCKFLPQGWSKNNPIDILGDAKADLYEKTIKVLEKDNFFDFFIIILTPQYMTEPDKTADILLNLKTKKPILVSFMGGKKVEGAIKKLSEKFPVFMDIKELSGVLEKFG
jgi:acyl-CoA synthetase (NDP forming)